MLSSLYQLYFQENLALARSVVFKSQAAIDALDRFFRSVNRPESDDPLTWKYYLNLAGEYHWSDTQMRVISSDTEVEISFDKVTLEDHPLTRAEYLRGSTLRASLVERYPTQEALIDRILNPIDINVAIAARDFEILYHTPSLIAANETNLIPRLQLWIDNMSHRWFVYDMTITDSLYAATFMATLYLNMVKEIASIRLDNAKTPQASQWHIWTYLGGFLGLNRFRGSLNLDQTLYLYRNIEHIRRNAGTEKILQELIDEILIPGGLIASRFDMLKVETRLESEGIVEPRFNLAEYYETNVIVDEAELIDSAAILAKTTDKGLFNLEREAANAITLSEGVLGRIDNTHNTNLLEVSQRYNPLSRFTETSQIKVDYWLYMSAKGLYTAPISIDIPGRSRVILNPLETAILMIYATARGLGKTENDICRIVDVNLPSTATGNVVCGTIPKIDLHCVIPDQYRPLSEVEGFMDPEHVNIPAAMGVINDAILPLRHLSSLADLDDFALEIANQNFLFYRARSAAIDFDGEAMVDNATASLLINEEVTLNGTDISFTAWLAANDINVDGLTEDDFRVVAVNCLRQAAGVDELNLGLPSYQKDMVEIVDILSSYGIIIREGRAFGTNASFDWYVTNPSQYKVANDITLREGLGTLRYDDFDEGFLGTEVNVSVELHDFNLEVTVETDVAPEGNGGITTEITGESDFTMGGNTHGPDILELTVDVVDNP